LLSFHLRLKNDLKYNVKVFCVDFDGYLVSYGVAKRDKLFELTSYFRHAFVFYNDELGQGILIEMGDPSFTHSGSVVKLSSIPNVVCVSKRFLKFKQ